MNNWAQGLSPDYHLTSTLKMASAQVVETSVADKSPSQDSNHPDDLFQSRYVTSRVETIFLLKICIGSVFVIIMQKCVVAHNEGAFSFSELVV